MNDSPRVDEWGEPKLSHAVVFHVDTVSCMCGRMLPRTAHDAETAQRMWLEHVRDRADRIGARR